MGYDTSYTLRVQNIEEDEFDQLILMLDAKELIGYAFSDYHDYDLPSKQGYFDSNGDCHWYDHEDDLIEISKKFPNARFRLSGLGEKRYDIWNRYYENGKIENCGVIIEEVKPTEIRWDKEVI